MSHPAVEITGFRKTFSRGRLALEIDGLHVQPGEMVVLIGASASGKSTLLRHIAGLMLADRDGGRILVHGAPMQGSGRMAHARSCW